MKIDDENQELLDRLLENLVQQYRLGSPPELEEYCRKYPELASSLREFFPTLCFLEQNKPKTNPAVGVSSRALNETDRIGDYQLIREIGRGGMGVVYEALQLSLRRHVALKVMTSHLATNALAVARFEREARAAAHLHHSNIVPIFDVGIDQDTCYYAMQFIQGQSLDHVLAELRFMRRSRTTSAPEVSIANDLCNLPNSTSTDSTADRNLFRNVARLGLQIAEALAYAHDRRVIHRDIKPSNILVDQQGVAWITDFGLAKQHPNDALPAAESDLTNTGDFLGTLRYLAPERLQGKHDVLGDLYGLGATLYELLSLRPIFDSSDRLLLIKEICERIPTPLRKLDSRIPRDFETIVHKCIDKDPRLRYQSASFLVNDLQLFLLDRPIQARRSSWLESSLRWCRRNRQVASLGALSLVLVAALVVGLFFNRALQHERDLALSSMKRAASAETDADTRALLKEVAAVRLAGTSGLNPYFQKLRNLDKTQMRVETAREIRNEWASCAMRLDFIDGKPITISHNVAAIDREMQWMAEVTINGEIHIKSMRGSAEPKVVKNLGFKPSVVEFSRHGRFLKASHAGLYQVIDCQSGTLPLSTRPIEAIDLDVDDLQSLVATSHADQTVRVRSLGQRDREDSLLTIRLNFLARQVRMSGDGKWLVAVGNEIEDHVQLIDLKARELGLNLPGRNTLAIAWSPDGKYLAVVEDKSQIRIWESETMSLVGTLVGHNAQIFQLDWDQESKLLQSRSWDGVTILWHAASRRKLLSAYGLSSSIQFGKGDVVGWKSEEKLLTPVMLSAPLYEDLPVTAHGRSSIVQFMSQNAKDNVAAVCCADQVYFVDLETGGIVGAFASEPAFFADFSTRRPELLLLCRDYIQQWSIERKLDSNADVSWEVKPPTIVKCPGMSSGFPLADCNHAVVALAEGTSSLAKIELSTGEVLKRFGELSFGDSIRRIGNGPLLATSNWHSAEINIWNFEEERFVGRIPVEVHSTWVASPDGSQFATIHNDRIRFWIVDTQFMTSELKLDGFMISNAAAFSADGKILYARCAYNRICAIDVLSNQIALRIDDDTNCTSSAMQLLDSGQLVDIDSGIGRVRLWDLWSLGQDFASHGIDFESQQNGHLLPTSSRRFAKVPHRRLKIEIQGEIGQRDAFDPKVEIEVMRKRLDVNPNDPFLINGLAWSLLMAPIPFRNDSEAMRLAKRAASQSPDDPNCRNTLALAHFRNGDLEEAKTLLIKNLSTQTAQNLTLDLMILSAVSFLQNDSQGSDAYYEWAQRNRLDHPTNNPLQHREFQLLTDERNHIARKPE